MLWKSKDESFIENDGKSDIKKTVGIIAALTILNKITESKTINPSEQIGFFSLGSSARPLLIESLSTNKKRAKINHPVWLRVYNNDGAILENRVINKKIEKLDEVFSIENICIFSKLGVDILMIFDNSFLKYHSGKVAPISSSIQDIVVELYLDWISDGLLLKSSTYRGSIFFI